MSSPEPTIDRDFLRTLSVLYVEDDTEVRDQLARFLRRYFASIDVACNGQEGLARFGECRHDVVVTDVRMPIMDGLEMAQRIKASDRDVPIIIVSAFSDTANLMRAIEIGIDSYVKKPLDTTELLNAVYKNTRVSFQQRELEKAQQRIRDDEEKFRKITSSAQDAILMMDDTGRISYWNAAAEKIFGYPEDEAMGQDLHGLIVPERQREAFRSAYAGYLETGSGLVVGKTLEVVALRRGNVEFPAELSVSALALNGKRFAMAILRDITDRKRAEAQLQKLNEELEARVESRTHELSAANAKLREDQEKLRDLVAKLEQAQTQLLQAEKMASIGQLAAGVAHEINNPIGYINSNLNTLTSYIEGLLKILGLYERCEPVASGPGGAPDAAPCLKEIDALKQELDIDFLREDTPSLVSESVAGIRRVKEIVQSLKDFAHVDEGRKQKVDIHQGLEGTLKLVWNELKYKAEVVKEYGKLPMVECNASQLNQVFMNLLVNAAQAIEDKGTITVRTGAEGDMVWIDVIDTGSGVAPENLKRLFDPFFTTKPVGKGTGLGLSISYGIVQQHNGRIEVDSTPGKGTRFRVWLPVDG